jgi:hypothetical protein
MQYYGRHVCSDEVVGYIYIYIYRMFMYMWKHIFPLWFPWRAAARPWFCLPLWTPWPRGSLALALRKKWAALTYYVTIHKIKPNPQNPTLQPTIDAMHWSGASMPPQWTIVLPVLQCSIYIYIYIYIILDILRTRMQCTQWRPPAGLGCQWTRCFCDANNLITLTMCVRPLASHILAWVWL